MKRFLGLIALAVVLSGCAAQTTNYVEAVSSVPALSVVAFDQDYISKYECKEVWQCLPVKLESTDDCPIVELNYGIYLEASDSPVIASAKAYKYNVPAGRTLIEYGVNNLLKVAISLGEPKAKCLQELPKTANTDSLFDLPKSMCEKGKNCSASALTGFDLNNIVTESTYVSEITGSQSGGDSGESGTWTPVVGDGNGYAVYCADGSISNSGGIQGACSHHGGVAD